MTSGSADVQATYCATLVDEWVARGLTHAVICPGSRSTPMAVALATRDEIRSEVFHDERAGSFAALGVGLATGRPAVVLTTSGTAAVELHAAVVESHQAAVPMLVVTADRPPELRDTWAPQTIDQRELYGVAVRWFCEPGTVDPAHRDAWRSLATEAWQRTTGRVPGAVHLNLAFTEPLSGTAGDLPARTDPDRPPPELAFGLLDEQLGRLVSATAGRRVLVVAGVRAATDPQGAVAIHAAAERLGWPIVADHLSGLRDGAAGTVTAADAILRAGDAADALRPDVVLRCGGLPASRVVLEWMATTGALQIGIDRLGRTPDPTGSLGASHAVEPEVVLAQLADAPAMAPAPDEWRAAWELAERVATERIEAGRPREAQVLATLADGFRGTLFVSSSMPIRDLEWYVPGHRGLTVRANRGANGIDGVVSTAVGVALTGEPTCVVVGDVAMLHDTNALIGLAARDVRLLVVVIDNDGGGIFSMLPQSQLLDSDRFEQLFGTPHGADIAGLAAAHGVRCDVIGSEDPVAGPVAAIRDEWVAGGGVRMTVVRSDRSRNHAEHVEVHRAVTEAVATALGGTDGA